MSDKRTRTRLAKSELWLQAACTVQRWATYAPRGNPHTPLDDPLLSIARTYDLTDEDLRHLLTKMAQELENRALRQGYDEHWDDPLDVKLGNVISGLGREPLPGDGPDYHADHAAWEHRQQERKSSDD